MLDLLGDLIAGENHADKRRRSVLRVALPAWRIQSDLHKTKLADKAVEHAAFKSLFENGLRPLDPLHLRLTSGEKNQMVRSATIRSAIYDVRKNL